MKMRTVEGYKACNYTNFQLIAYEIPTHTPTPPGRECDFIKDIPVPAYKGDISPEVKVRLRQLAAVVDLAEKNVKRRNDSSYTLKIFMAPEFFFRPKRSSKIEQDSFSYDEGTDLMIQLQYMFKHKKFKDWLFIPGTVLYREEVGTRIVKTLSRLSESGKAKKVSKGGKQDEIGEVIYWNTAVTLKGGFDPAPYIYVDKRKISGADRIKEDEVKKDAFRSLSYRNVFEGSSNWKQNIQTLDNVTWGVEICMDHYCRVLQKTRDKYQEMYEKDQEDQDSSEKKEPTILHLHMLVACGQDIIGGNLAIQPGGYVLHSEGGIDKRGRVQSQVNRIIDMHKFTYKPIMENCSKREWTLPIPDNLKKITPKEIARKLTSKENVEELVCYSKCELPRLSLFKKAI